MKLHTCIKCKEVPPIRPPWRPSKSGLSIKSVLIVRLIALKWAAWDKKVVLMGGVLILSGLNSKTLLYELYAVVQMWNEVCSRQSTWPLSYRHPGNCLIKGPCKGPSDQHCTATTPMVWHDVKLFIIKLCFGLLPAIHSDFHDMFSTKLFTICLKKIRYYI